MFCKTLPACYRKQHLEKTKICRKRPKRHRKKGKTVKFCTTHHNLFQRKQPCYEQWAVDTKHTATLRRFPVSGKTKATKQKEATKKRTAFGAFFGATTSKSPVLAKMNHFNTMHTPYLSTLQYKNGLA